MVDVTPSGDIPLSFFVTPKARDVYTRYIRIYKYIHSVYVSACKKSSRRGDFPKWSVPQPDPVLSLSVCVSVCLPELGGRNEIML